MILPPKVPCCLTPRQRQALQLLAEGNTGKEAAKLMGISPLTLKWHVHNARRRLSASTTAHAVAVAVQRGEVEVE